MFSGTTAVTAASNYGTAPPAQPALGVNAYVTNTVAVSGTVAFSNTTIAVTNAGTFAVQAAQSGNWYSRTEDGVGNLISSTSEGSPPTTGLNVHVQNTVPVGGTVSVSSVSGTVAVSNASLSELSFTATGSPPVYALNVYNEGGSVSVTGSVAVTGTFWQAVQPVSGTVAVTNPALSELSFTSAGSPPANYLNVIAVGGLTNNNAAPGANNLGVLPAVAQSAVQAYTAGDQVLPVTDLRGAAQVTMLDGCRTTYRAAVRAFTPVASTTSPFFSLQGSATKTVRVTRLRLMVSAATGATCDVQLGRFSALTGGTTGSTPSIFKNDTADAAATAVALQYSAVPTTATQTGGFAAEERYEIVTASPSVPIPAIDFKFGDVPGARAWVLRGTSDYLGILISAVGTTPVADIWIEFTEE
jgi:hypothetical protein